MDRVVIFEPVGSSCSKCISRTLAQGVARRKTSSLDVKEKGPRELEVRTREQGQTNRGGGEGGRQKMVGAGVGAMEVVCDTQRSVNAAYILRTPRTLLALSASRPLAGMCAAAAKGARGTPAAPAS